MPLLMKRLMFHELLGFPFVSQIGETSLNQVFTNDFWGNPLHGGAGTWTHKSYRPLAVLSFAWQFKLLEEGPFDNQ